MIETLNNSFKDYRYFDHNHSYLHIPTDTQLTSVTQLLKKLVPPFNERYWLPYKVFQKNGYDVKYESETSFLVNGSRFKPYIDNLDNYDLEISADDLKYHWYILSLVGSSRGTILHNYLESLWNRKIMRDITPDIINKLSALEAIDYIKSIDIIKKLAYDLYNELILTHVPVATEYVVGDIDFKIAGTFDLLLYNTLTGKYEIWDYKTDKSFNTSGRDYIKGFNVQQCEMNKYSLQLNIYKYLIEKNSGIKIDKCIIVHFDYKKNTKTTINCLDYSDLVKDFFHNGNNLTTYL